MLLNLVLKNIYVFHSGEPASLVLSVPGYGARLVPKTRLPARSYMRRGCMNMCCSGKRKDGNDR